MNWFRRRNRVQIRFTLRGKTLFADVPPAVAEYCDAQRRRITELDAEAVDLIRRSAATAEDARREHERQQHRIDALVEIKHGLDEELDAKAAFIRALEKQLDTALAQVKKLDAELVETAAELVQAQGELATAREEIAGYRLAVGS